LFVLQKAEYLFYFLENILSIRWEF